MKLTLDNWRNKNNPEFWKMITGDIALFAGFVLSINALVFFSMRKWLEGSLNSFGGILLGCVAISFILYNQELKRALESAGKEIGKEIDKERKEK